MDIILNNPYRILGVLVNASARERNNASNKLKIFLEAGKNIDNDYSFATLGELQRDTNSIEKAENILFQPYERLKFSLFWFLKGTNSIDEKAFEKISRMDFSGAKSLWETYMNGGITSENYSAYFNISTLYLFLYTVSKKQDYLGNAVEYKIKFINSVYLNEYLKLIDIGRLEINEFKILSLYLNTIYEEIKKLGEIRAFLTILKNEKFPYKEQSLECILEEEKKEIEKLVENCRIRRSRSPSDALKASEDLYKEAKEKVNLLKSFNSEELSKAGTDRVAEEILQCVIDYFDFYQDSHPEKINVSYLEEQIKKAEDLAEGILIKERCKENLKALKKWGESHKLEKEFAYIQKELETASKSHFSIDLARSLLDSCKPKLAIIRERLGKNDEAYLMISTAVIVMVRRILITIINEEQARIDFIAKMGINRYELLGRLRDLYSLLKKAHSITLELERMDALLEVKESLRMDKKTLENIIDSISRNVPDAHAGCNKVVLLIIIIATIIYFL
ncbi:MAG: hypothetical protein N3G21_08085 [Candidatus Hydrogenedentes bacterium]|nr:hypothetical protein [Candidatus Hydrogenedentota bacterium]